MFLTMYNFIQTKEKFHFSTTAIDLSSNGTTSPAQRRMSTETNSSIGSPFKCQSRKTEKFCSSTRKFRFQLTQRLSRFLLRSKLEFRIRQSTIRSLKPNLQSIIGSNRVRGRKVKFQKIRRCKRELSSFWLLTSNLSIFWSWTSNLSIFWKIGRPIFCNSTLWSFYLIKKLYTIILETKLRNHPINIQVKNVSCFYFQPELFFRVSILKWRHSVDLSDSVNSIRDNSAIRFLPLPTCADQRWRTIHFWSTT
jgi:hypothetical protein